MDRRNDYFVRCKFFHEKADRRDVRDRIHRADLVEMDLIDRLAVHVALGLGDLLINSQYIQRHRSGKLQVIPHDMLDIMHAAVMVRMTMLMLVFMIVVMLMVV